MSLSGGKPAEKEKTRVLPIVLIFAVGKLGINVLINFQMSNFLKVFSNPLA